MTGQMGTDPTPVRVEPRHSNTRMQNLALVREQLIAAGKVQEAEQFLSAYNVLIAASPRRELADHPITIAARKVGADVHWVK